MVGQPDFHTAGSFLVLIVITGYFNIFLQRHFLLRIRGTTLVDVLDITFVAAAEMLSAAMEKDRYHSRSQFAESWFSLYSV